MVETTFIGGGVCIWGAQEQSAVSATLQSISAVVERLQSRRLGWEVIAFL